MSQNESGGAGKDNNMEQAVLDSMIVLIYKLEQEQEGFISTIKNLKQKAIADRGEIATLLIYRDYWEDSKAQLTKFYQKAKEWESLEKEHERLKDELRETQSQLGQLKVRNHHLACDVDKTRIWWGEYQWTKKEVEKLKKELANDRPHLWGGIGLEKELVNGLGNIQDKKDKWVGQKTKEEVERQEKELVNGPGNIQDKKEQWLWWMSKD